MSGKKLSEKISRMNEDGFETESQIPEMLQLKIEDLELIKQDLIDEIEHNKLKARGLLMRKELSERRIKLVVYKLESYLKSDTGGSLSQEQVNEIGKLNEHELNEQYELEKELEEEIQATLEQQSNTSTLRPTSIKQQESSGTADSILEQMNVQLQQATQAQEGKAQDGSGRDETLVYICNVFLKYLETLYSIDTGKK